MYCGQCGRSIDDRAIQCPHCGHRITGVMPIRSAPPDDPPAAYRPRVRPPRRHRRRAAPPVLLPLDANDSRARRPRKRWGGWRVIGTIVVLITVSNLVRSCGPQSTPPRTEPDVQMPPFRTPDFSRDVAPPPSYVEFDEATRERLRELLQRDEFDGRLTPRTPEPGDDDASDADTPVDP